MTPVDPPKVQGQAMTPVDPPESEAGEEVLSSKFWVLSFRRARLAGLVQPNKQNKPKKPN